MALSTSWHLHLNNETKGPFSTSKVLAMLEEGQLQFFDFAWKEGLSDWVRLSELPEFSSYLPAHPTAPLPNSSKPKAEFEAKSQPKPEPKAEFKQPPKLSKQEPGEQSKSVIVQPEPVKPAIPSKYLRVPFEGNVASKNHGKFPVLNIAERGVFVCAENPVDAGTELKFTLSGEPLKKPLEMTGIVVRKSRDGEPSGFVIEFTRINPAHKRIIEEYIRATTEK